MLSYKKKGRENIHEVKISHFAATTDAKRRVFIFSTIDELTKNHQDDNDSSEDDNMCPVGSFMKNKRHLNSKCNILFQRPSIRKNAT
ncbi:hypothetical protein KUTeg_003451 [Tegillarca granosa]|uniref:Uncharacterized protein n=1 Tax=Tegillarca granosa TaxID=220873 RepID=A0ABQ9FRL9_TEGGR|nr:hypothetical protein KUTeg_003451 [Tegillarca granosa]